MLYLALLAALGVGGATILGVLVGFVLRDTAKRFSNVVLSFAAGVMLAAAIFGLILPATEQGGLDLLLGIAGVLSGAVCLAFAERLVPYMAKLAGCEPSADGSVEGVMLFVLAIAIHNLPEGLAAGVGFGAGEVGEAMLIAGGIALQNVPEGMVIVPPMLASGVRPFRTFLLAALTGVVEIIGTLIGYFAVRIAAVMLPFALGFAGGTMLYVIGDEMIPRTHKDENARASTFSLLVGFCLMLVFCVLV